MGKPRILLLTLEQRPIGCRMTSPDGGIYWDVNNILHALKGGYDEVRIVLKEESHGKPEAEGQ